MNNVSYAQSSIHVRADIERAHRQTWLHIAMPGPWWTGAERVAIAAETRAALNCRFCAERKKALSPNMVQGSHDTVTNILPSPAIEAIHRLRIDIGRLSESWVKNLIAQGLSEGAYVELAGVMLNTLSVDTFARAVGVPLHPLPAPVSGDPSGYVPQGLDYEGTWVRIFSDEASQAGPDCDTFYPVSLLKDRVVVASVNRGLAQAPDEVRNFFNLCRVGYIHCPDVGNIPAYSKYRRAIDPLQMELIGSRVSALNICLYCAASHVTLLERSAKTLNQNVALEATIGDASVGDGGIKHGRLLARFVEAVMGVDDKLLDSTREELRRTIGDEALVDVCGVISVFNAINRIPHVTGLPIQEGMEKLSRDHRERLGLNEFAAWQKKEKEQAPA